MTRMSIYVYTQPTILDLWVSQVVSLLDVWKDGR